MTWKLLLEIATFSCVLIHVSGQFDHFPAQPDSQDGRLPPPPPPAQTPLRPVTRPKQAPPSAPIPQHQPNLEINNRVPASNTNRGRIRGRVRPKVIPEEQKPEKNPRSQRVRVPERNNVREQPPRTPVARVPSRTNEQKSTTEATKKPIRQRIRIRPPKAKSEIQDEKSNVRLRQRVEQPTTPLITTPAPVITERPRTLKQDSKQTFGQSLNGIFDPESLTVFADPKDVRKPITTVQQFQIPEVSKIRTLPDPKITELQPTTPRSRPQFQVPTVSKIRTFAEPKIVEPSFTNFPKEEKENQFVPIQEIITEKEDLPLFNVEPARQPVEKPKPFVSFSALPQQEPTKLRPLPFQSPVQPPPQQQPRAQFVQPSPAVQQQARQPTIRQPQPIPFQTRPVQTLNTQPAPAPAPRDPFQERPSLFDQPFEIPANTGGASFSYEAVVGRR